MKLQEAKQRHDYRFRFTCTDNWFPIEDLRNGEFSYFTDYQREYGEFYSGLIMLEIGDIDIELNIFAESDASGDGYINKVCASYFGCYRNADGEWVEFGYLDDECGLEVEVDWNAENWLSLLEEDMFKKLMQWINISSLV